MAFPTATDLALANASLARLSEPAISAFTENSKAARMATRMYPLARNLVFSAGDWEFATARIGLGTGTGNVATGNIVYPWGYEYLQPANLGRARIVVPLSSALTGAGDPVPYERGINTVSGVDARVIWCDLVQGVLVYTRIVIDPDLWDDGFKAAFTVQLAAEMCLGLTGSEQLAMAIRKEAGFAIAAVAPTQVQSVTQRGHGPSTTTAAREG